MHVFGISDFKMPEPFRHCLFLFGPQVPEDFVNKGINLIKLWPCENPISQLLPFWPIILQEEFMLKLNKNNFLYYLSLTLLLSGSINI